MPGPWVVAAARALAATARTTAGATRTAASKAGSPRGAAAHARPKGGFSGRVIKNGTQQRSVKQPGPGHKSPDGEKAESGWRRFKSAFDDASNLGWQIQSWESLIEQDFPSLTCTTSVSTAGKKGTPTKNVLHAALAATFGAAQKSGLRFGHMTIKIKIDHMNNAVNIEFVTTQRFLGYAIPTLLERIEALVPNTPTSVSDAARDLFGLFKQWNTANANLFVSSIINPPIVVLGGMAADAARDPKVAQKQLKDMIIESWNKFNRNYNMGFARELWSDPVSAVQAQDQGAVCKEAILPGFPPSSLMPDVNKNTWVPDYPEPFKTILHNRQELVTRLPSTNPVPPVPRDRDKDWKYGVQPPLLDVEPNAGYDFDLRSLVAQALSDPGIRIDRPDTNLSLKVQRIN